MKRFLAVLLCLLICVSMLPVYSFAEAADVDYDDVDMADLVGAEKKEQQHTHDLTYVPAVEPGCNGGYEAYYICKDCDSMFSAEDQTYEIYEIPTLAPKHTKPIDEKQITRIAATCTEKGQIKYKCAVCGQDVTDYQKALGHQLTIHPYTAQTCTTDGNYTYYSCDRCGNLYWNEQAEYAIAQSDIVIPKGHSLTHVDAVAPTCTESGNIEYYVCGACEKMFSDADGAKEITESVVRSAMGHNIVKVEARASTCAVAGNIEHWKCEYCGTLFADAEGMETTTTEAVAIPKLQHTLTRAEAHAATCDTDGNIENWSCSGCEGVFLDEAGENAVGATDVVVEKLSHDLEEIPAKPACKEDGNIQYWVCKRDNCGKLFSDAEGTKEITLAETVVPKIGHHDFNGGFCTVCRAEDPDYKGPAFKDANITFTPGQDLVIRIDADYETTVDSGWSITIGGITITEESVEVTPGSSIFTISGEALVSLEPGEYEITITTEQGTVKGKLRVEEAPTTYDVIIPGVSNGKITVDKSKPTEGETITLTVIPDTGYILKKNSLSVKDENGTGITVTNNKFEMPASNVTVTAEFVKEFTVKFDTVLPIDTVKKPDSIKVQGGDTIAAADMPEPEDSAKHHSFKGWYKDKDYKTPFKAGTDTITADTTLYAKWAHDYPHDSKDALEGKGICPYCWEADHSFTTGVKDPDFTAEIVRGNGKTAHYGSYFPMTVNTYYRYVKGSVEVKVDGKTLSADKYTVYAPKHGTSTVVELERAYVRSLPVGKYAISIKTNLGTAKGFFWVSSSPKTADDSNVALYVTVGVVSAAAVAGIAYYLIKKRRK